MAGGRQCPLWGAAPSSFPLLQSRAQSLGPPCGQRKQGGSAGEAVRLGSPQLLHHTHTRPSCVCEDLYGRPAVPRRSLRANPRITEERGQSPADLFHHEVLLSLGKDLVVALSPRCEERPKRPAVESAKES